MSCIFRPSCALSDIQHTLTHLKTQQSAILHQVKRESIYRGTDHLVLDEVSGGAEVFGRRVDAVRLWCIVVTQLVWLGVTEGVLCILHREDEGLQCCDDVLKL